MITRLTLSLLALFYAATLADTSQAKGQATAAKIEELRVQLLYERSGTLSLSIAPPATFNAWNTMIGEGDAKEPANDLIVSAVLSVKTDQANVSTPLKITVKGKGGKVLAERTFRGLFFSGGKVVRAVLVPDAACAGPLNVEANLGAETKRTSVTLACGE
jgi:hypothetical protein